MNEAEKNKAKSVFERYPSIGIAYVFGSRARETEGLMSDYDFAVYADLSDREVLFELELSLRNELSLAFATDAIDLVMINTADSPELKYAIIKEGIVLFEREPFRVIIEPKILNDYFDYRAMLRRYELTKA